MSAPAPTVENTPSDTSAHTPAGYCPHCCYRIDPGTCPECGRDVPEPAPAPTRRYIRRALPWLTLLVAAALLYSYGPYYAFYYLLARESLVEKSRMPGQFTSLAWRVMRAQRRGTLFAERAQLFAIESELQSVTGHDWAGEYSMPETETRIGRAMPRMGNGLLLLTPSRRWYWAEAECTGCSNINDWGRITRVTRDRIYLRSDFPYPVIGPARTVEYVRIRWNGRHYLLTPESADTLAPDAASDAAAAERHGYELIARTADRDITLIGPPDSPAKLRERFAAAPGPNPTRRRPALEGK
jgi:hypothetical protein